MSSHPCHPQNRYKTYLATKFLDKGDVLFQRDKWVGGWGLGYKGSSSSKQTSKQEKVILQEWLFKERWRGRGRESVLG